MTILEKRASREPCSEAGWYAWDYVLDEAIDDAFVCALRPLGSFLYLKALARPFFKIESDYFILKGVLGDDFFRMAVHGDHRDEMEKLERFVGELR